jgi:serine protease
MKSPKRACVYGTALLAVGLWGCEAPPSPKASPPPASVATKPKPGVNEAQKALQEASEKDRLKYAEMSFEEFESSKAVYHEPFAGGKYIVNGDTPVANEKQLREFFESKVKRPPPATSALILARISGLDAIWNDSLKGSLSYCVSKPGFGQEYDTVVRDMQDATAAWQGAAAIGFVHDASQDAQCSASNQAVVFDVRPVDVGGEYLARAFFPNEPRAERNVLIDQSALDLGATEKPQLVGILRHELGHSLGFRHEHTRPSAGTCFEDSNWTVLTEYDPYSVMHYPQCHGRGDWSLTLTDRDKSGAACAYGAATGFTLDTSLVDMARCRTDQPVVTGQARTQSFDSQSVLKGAESKYGPFPVVAGSQFEASISGSNATGGDPDLYVRFGSADPGVSAYDCRPYLVGPNETCALNVPPDKTEARVMVRGYEAGKYKLQVSHVPPSN